MSGDGAVRFQRRGPVAEILFDRPAARNALNEAMLDQLTSALDRLHDVGLRVAVLRGAAGHFVAGADIAGFEGLESAEDGLAYEARMEGIFRRLETVPVATLAVVEGYAVGGGLMLAASCDLRICTPDARFGMPIARTLGNALSVPNLRRLVAHLGPSRLTALIFLADFLSGEEAVTLGFALEVVEPEELEARVDAICRSVASHAPLTLRATKEALRRIRDGGKEPGQWQTEPGRGVTEPGRGEKGTAGDDPDPADPRETASETREPPPPPDALEGADLLRRIYGSRDFHEGVRSFLEKRPPEWEGR
ncbi:MAG: enoyl-CoA hydratase-related protein [Gemmatimonadota bacterium]